MRPRPVGWMAAFAVLGPVFLSGCGVFGPDEKRRVGVPRRIHLRDTPPHFINIVIIYFVIARSPMGKSDHIGEFEQLALLAVMRLGDAAYGARIQEELESTAGRKASISAIYITLTRLQEKGLVSSWMGEPTAERGGKARRFFEVLPTGVAALDHARSQLLSMWDGLEGDLEGAHGR